MEIRQEQVTANGLQFTALACSDTGSVASGSPRPLALCLHGFPDTPHTFRHLLPALAEAGFRVVAPWTRGYRPTDVPDDGEYSLSALAADANALHDAFDGDGDAVLVGHDWGAMTSYLAGALEPARWRRMVTMAVPPPATAAAAFLKYAQLKRSFYIFLFQTGLAPVVGADDLAFIDGLWADWSPSYDATTDLEEVKRSLRDPANLMAAIGYYRAMFGAAGSPAVGAHQQPTLYLHGDADGAFGVEGVAGADEELPPGSRVEIISDVGHFLHLERPDKVNDLTVSWLTQS